MIVWRIMNAFVRVWVIWWWWWAIFGSCLWRGRPPFVLNVTHLLRCLARHHGNSALAAGSHRPTALFLAFS